MDTTFHNQDQKERTHLKVFSLFTKDFSCEMATQAESFPSSVLANVDNGLLWLRHRDLLLHVQMVHSFNPQ